MPNAAPRPCNHPGCGKLVHNASYCEQHQKAKRKQSDDRRGSSTARGYGSRWQKYRERYLREHPLCVMHEKRGLLEPATVVDHIEPHKGDHKLFWDPKNHQGLCKHCHDSHKKRLEMSGRVSGCDLNGMPIDANHHWNT